MIESTVEYGHGGGGQKNTIRLRIERGTADRVALVQREPWRPVEIQWV